MNGTRIVPFFKESFRKRVLLTYHRRLRRRWSFLWTVLSGNHSGSWFHFREIPRVSAPKGSPTCVSGGNSSAVAAAKAADIGREVHHWRSGRCNRLDMQSLINVILPCSDEGKRMVGTRSSTAIFYWISLGTALFCPHFMCAHT